jgi:RimJ/RimL family protein N-acetyltransferase
MVSVMESSIASERLDLRAFADEDAIERHEIFSDPETHTIGEGPVTDLAVTQDWIRRRRFRTLEHGVVWYALRVRGDNRIIGSAGLFMGRTDPHPEFGFEVRRSLQGQGFGREAATVVVAEAHRAGFSEVWATVREWNQPSLRVLSKIGFERDRIANDNGPLVYLRHYDARPPVTHEPQTLHACEDFSR